jgi:3-oxoacyl-[acyl-carrier-protein] synthase-1
MSGQPLAILSSGMISGVGLTAPASCAAIRCGIDNFQETRFIDSGGEWIMGSSVPMEKPWRGIAKLSKMLASAFQECLSSESILVLEEIPIVFCLSEKDRPGRFAELEERIFLETQEEIGIRFHEKSSLLSHGRVGLGIALQQARRLIYGENIPRVIIAGVDSLLVEPTLNAYEEQERLLTSQNSNGFIPGEAAAAVLVGPALASNEEQLLCLGVGSGVERATEQSELPLRADGLVQAIRAALTEAGCSLGAMDFRITDVSGGQYSFKEANLALTRILRERQEEFDIWHPADCIGEVGAAIGAVILVVCLAATRKAYAPGNNILCHLANEDGNRVAIVLSYKSVGRSNG